MSSGLLKLLTPVGSPPLAASPSSSDAGAAQHQPQSLTHAGSRLRPFASPPCCCSCGAAKAEGCSGCGGAFCRACMVLQLSSKATGGCSNCDKLCSSCKPVACSFCEELRDQEAPVRMCEACAGGCDACQRPACGACRAAFSSCNSCGFAACEDCCLQMQLTQPGSNNSSSSSSKAGAGPLTSSGSLGCWCAPPLRMASNVSHVSSQRYQMAQLHPSLLSSTMEATGLRDADYDEDDTFEYEEMEEEEEDVLPVGGHADDDEGLRRSSSRGMPAPSGGGGSASRYHQGSLPAGEGVGRHQPGSGCATTTTLSQQRVEALIGSLPSMAGGVHVLPSAAVPLSPSSSSSHSSGAHHQFYGPVSQLFGLPGLARHHHQYHHY